MYYADQRYYYSNWGRFLTADPSSNHRRGLRSSGAWNKYSYSLGDPINRNDKHGTCSAAIAGSTQDPFSGSGADVYNLFQSLGAVTGLPFASLNLLESLAAVDASSFSLVGPTQQSGTAAQAIQWAINQSPSGTITLYCFSGGAQACNSAVTTGNINPSSIAYVVYISPGFGQGINGLPGVPTTILGGTQGTYVISNLFSVTDAGAGFFLSLNSVVPSQGPAIQGFATSCDHDFSCSMTTNSMSADGNPFNPASSSLTGGPCSTYDYFASPDAGGGGGDPADDDDDDDDAF